MQGILQGLTSVQREAVEHVEGPLLILAGPGSGKTRVVTHRIARLLEKGVHPGELLALTFTNKAAEEMRARLERLVPNRQVWVGTYHRFAARLLRRYAPLVGLEENYSIYDAEESARALRRVVRRLKLDLGHFTPESVAAAVSWAKNNLITPDEYQSRPGHPLGSVVLRVYPAYQADLARSNAADFDDLLLHVATILRESPDVRRALDERYRFVLVDEYQDTNFAQYAIARSLSIDHPNLAVTGDPDQSIYGWRGANLKNILEFEKDFPNVRIVRLERNYRSTKRILRVAARLIAHNVKRKEKDLYTENGQGPPVRLITFADQKDEAQSIAARIAREVRAGRFRPRDYAIFYRVNALSRAFEFALREQGLPYQMIHGQEFFRRKEIKDILGYLLLVNNPRDDMALLRVINAPPRGIGKTTIERLSAHAARRGLTLLEAARECREVESLSKRAAGLVAKFVGVFDRLAEVADAPVEEILGHVLTASEYRKRLEKSDREEDQDRLANIEELLTAAREFDEREPGPIARGTPDPARGGEVGRPAPSRLEEFLEETALVGETDDWAPENDRVTLMTLHASKGLEFPVVYLVAAEEGLLPHERSRQHNDQLEEERRLMFVGITRAKQELQISRAGYRDFRGQRKMTVPSRFLMELPRGEMEVEDQAAAAPSWAEPPYEAPLPSGGGRSLRCGRSPDRATPIDGAGSPLPIAGTATSLHLTTAAELAGSSPMPAPAPDQFHQGMLVRHPQHGLGRVVALSGIGPRRKATVDFASRAGQKKFVIADSPLRPVKK